MILFESAWGAKLPFLGLGFIFLGIGTAFVTAVLWGIFKKRLIVWNVLVVIIAFLVNVVLIFQAGIAGFSGIAISPSTAFTSVLMYYLLPQYFGMHLGQQKPPDMFQYFVVSLVSLGSLLLLTFAVGLVLSLLGLASID